LAFQPIDNSVKTSAFIKWQLCLTGKHRYQYCHWALFSFDDGRYPSNGAGITGGAGSRWESFRQDTREIGWKTSNRYYKVGERTCLVWENRKNRFRGVRYFRCWAPDIFRVPRWSAEW